MIFTLLYTRIATAYGTLCCTEGAKANLVVSHIQSISTRKLSHGFLQCMGLCRPRPHAICTSDGGTQPSLGIHCKNHDNSYMYTLKGTSTCIYFEGNLLVVERYYCGSTITGTGISVYFFDACYIYIYIYIYIYMYVCYCMVA